MKKNYILTFLILLSLVMFGRLTLHSLYHPEQSSPTLSFETITLPEPINQTVENIQRFSDATVQALPAVIPDAEAAKSIESSISREERELLLSLRSIRENINKQEVALEARVKAAEDAETRAADRIVELEKLEKRIENMLEQENSIKNKKIKRLTAVYEGMKPEKAAPVIANMELITVVKMFSRMDEKKVGKILSFLPTAKAVRISQALTKRIGSVGTK
ncbi:MAG: hypothetical protein R8M38_07605 [Mariprofundaceae bacterium]